MLGNIYGSHAPLRMQMEETILSQFQRFPGMKSSFVGLETILGTRDEIEFRDYLNDPDFSPEIVDSLSAMERRFGDGPILRQ